MGSVGNVLQDRVTDHSSAVLLCHCDVIMWMVLRDTQLLIVSTFLKVSCVFICVLCVSVYLTFVIVINKMFFLSFFSNFKLATF